MDVLIIHPSKICVDALKGMVQNFIFFEQGFKFIPTIVLIKVNCGTASLFRGGDVGALLWEDECKMVKNSLPNFEIERTAGENSLRVYTSGILMVTVAILLLVGGAHASDNGLVAEYHFDGDANDSSGNNNNGTIYGATFIDGILGLALSFDGVNDVVEVVDNDSIDLKDAGSIEAWIKYTGPLQARWFISKASEKGYNEYLNNYAMGIINGIGFGASIGAGSGIGDSVAAFHVITNNVWIHVAFTWDGTTLRLYKNGSEITNSTQRITPTINDQSLFIGKESSSDGYFFQGVIDEIRIYKRALSAEEVKAHYEQGIMLGVRINITVPIIINESTKDKLNAEFTNFSLNDPYNISITAPNGTKVYYDSGNITGANPEIIPINWTPSSIGNHTIEAWGRGMIDSTPIYIYDSAVVNPIPELSTGILTSVGLLGVLRFSRKFGKI